VVLVVYKFTLKIVYLLGRLFQLIALFINIYFNPMMNLKDSGKMVIGMIHIDALPGTPLHHFSLKQTIKNVVEQAEIYLSLGIDSIMIENMHDVPYLKGKVGPEIISSMTAVAVELRKMTTIPLGIQILAGANKEALAVALAAGFDFIRVEGFVFGHLADEGYFESCAGELLRYRKQIGAEEIAVFTDIKKKHSSHAITSDVSLGDTVKAADYFLSDGIVITGTSTGVAVNTDDLSEARNATSLPLLIGSGITVDNLPEYWNLADAFIVGSSLKVDGNWKNKVDSTRVKQLMNLVQLLRQNN
jgi:uncharacterized protein